MPLTLAPKTETEPLLTRVHRVRTRLRWVRILRQGSLIAVGLASAIVLSAWLDFRYQLPGLFRAVFLTGILTGAILTIQHCLIRPIRRYRDDLAVAHLIERRFPELNDALLSAVQFQKAQGESPNGSPALRYDTIVFAENVAEDVDFNQAVSSRWLKRSLFLLVLGILGVVWLLNRAPASSERALTRLIAPYGAEKWPPKTTIEILSPSLPHRMARREWFELRLQIRGVLPDRAIVSFWHDGGKPLDQSYPISKSEQASGETSFLVRLDADQIERGFRFRVRANDADTGWQRVDVRAPPMFAPRDGRPSPQIHLTYPAYTGLPAADLLDGGSSIAAVTGTLVTVRAAADQPVTRARLIFKPEQVNLGWSIPVALLGSRNALEQAAAVSLSEHAATEVPVFLSNERRFVDFGFVPWASGTYILRLEDEIGIASERSFDVRAELDPAPKVVIFRPTARKEAMAMASDASFDLTAIATDEKFALRQAFLEFRTNRDRAFRRIELVDAPTVMSLGPILATLMPAPLNVPAEGGSPLRACVFDRRWSLREFRHLDGASLGEGDSLSLRIGANDFDNITVGKPAGYSPLIEIRIVSRAAIEADIQRELTPLRDELMQLRDLQRDARSKVREGLKVLEQADRLNREQLERLQSAQPSQQQIRARFHAPEDGLLAKLNHLRQAIRDNEMPGSSLTHRVESIAADLERLAREELHPIEPLLEQALQHNELGKAKPSLSRAERHQFEVEETLRNTAERLEPWNATGDASGEGRSILSEIRKQIEALRQFEQSREPGLGGMKRKDLPEAHRQELDRAAVRPERLNERAMQLLDKLNRLASEKNDALAEKLDLQRKLEAGAKANDAEAKEQAKGSPAEQRLRQEAERLRDQADRQRDDLENLKAEIAALQKAAELAADPLVRNRLADVPTKIRDNQLGDAAATLRAAEQQLEKAVEALSPKPRPEDPDRLRKHARADGQRLNQLIEAQERLQKKIDAIKQNGDAGRQEEELRELSGEQEKLRQDAQELARQLNRTGNEEAARQLRRAAQEMDSARQQLEKGQAPNSSQDEALDRLDEAKEQFDRDHERDGEELLRQKLAEVSDLLKAIRDRQATAIDETKRLHAKVINEKKWSITLARNSLAGLIEHQRGLTAELRGLIEARFKDDVVFARMLGHSAEAMDAAVKRLNQRQEDVLDQLEGIGAFDAELEAQADRMVRRWQELALNRLDQLLDALKPDAEILRQPPKKAGPEPKMGEPAPEKPKQNPLPPLAQLRALRALQADIAERTTAFDRQHPKRDNLQPDDLLLLESLKKAQVDVADLAQQLLRSTETEEIP